MKSLDPRRALVVFSGGQDSTTCLWWATREFDHVETVTFDYGQRHRIELECAHRIADMAGVIHHHLPMDTLRSLGNSSLTDLEAPLDGSKGDDGLPATFVPGRNLLFITAAAALAYRLDCGALVTGVCETDYSGYPDCRAETLRLLEETLRLGMECSLKVHTPLMGLTKAQTVLLAHEVGAWEALAHSHTCYAGSWPPCGDCDACRLRAKGFAEAGFEDPLLRRARAT